MFYKEIKKLKKSQLQELLATTLQQKATLKRANASLISELNERIDDLKTESEKRRLVILETRSLNRQLKNELELKMLHKENSIYIDTPFTIELKKEIRQLHEELRQYKKTNQ